MSYLIIAAVLLVGGGLFLRWFVDAEPAKVRRALLWIAGGVGAALAVLLLLRLGTGALWTIGIFLVPALMRWRRLSQYLQQAARNARGPGPGQSSSVRSAFLEMSLDHDTGDLAGQVIAGRHAGRALDTMTLEELLELLAECGPADAQSGQLLESYLDRVHGDAWREAAADGAAGGEQASGRRSRSSGEDMTRSQALDILGLDEHATEQDIRDAHRRLMMANHPDRGGSGVIAAQINRAKEVLVGR